MGSQPWYYWHFGTGKFSPLGDYPEDCRIFSHRVYCDFCSLEANSTAHLLHPWGMTIKMSANVTKCSVGDKICPDWEPLLRSQGAGLCTPLKKQWLMIFCLASMKGGDHTKDLIMSSNIFPFEIKVSFWALKQVYLVWCTSSNFPLYGQGRLK